MSAPVLFAGAGAHGRDIRAIYRRVHNDDIEIYDDDPKFEILPTPQSYYQPCYVGINNSRERARIVGGPVLLGAVPLIDPSAVVGDDCSLGRGGVVGANTTLLTDVLTGLHVHIGFSCCMTRCTIGRFSTIAPGVVVCGDVQIGEESYIGAGAVISNLVIIGDRCIIGAGAVVTPGTIVPDDTTMVGVPAKCIS